MKHTIGSYAFHIGLLIAVVLGIISGLVPSLLTGAGGLILFVLIFLGLVAGLFNIKEEHRQDFLIAVIAITLVGGITLQQSVQLFPNAGAVATMVFQNLVAFLSPAALIVGLMELWSFSNRKAKK